MKKTTKESLETSLKKAKEVFTAPIPPTPNSPTTPALSKEEAVTAAILEGKPMHEALTSAGFSLDLSAPAKKIIPIAPGEAGFVQSLDERKRFALACLSDGKLRSSKPGELAKVIDILNKNHLLLTNRDTERRGVTVNVRTFGIDDPLLAALQDDQRRIITGEVIIENNEKNEEDNNIIER